MDELKKVLVEKSIDHMTEKFKEKLEDIVLEIMGWMRVELLAPGADANRDNGKIIIESMINLLMKELGWFMAASKNEGREISFSWLDDQLCDAMDRCYEEITKAESSCCWDDEDDEDDEDDDDEEAEECALGIRLRSERDFYKSRCCRLQDRLLDKEDDE